MGELIAQAGLEWLDAFHLALDPASTEMIAELEADRFDTMLAALRDYGSGFDALE